MLFDLHVSNNSIIGVLGDVITEGPDGPSIGTSSVVIIYIGYIYKL